MALPSPLKAELDEFTGEVLESEALRAEGLLQLRVALAAARSKDKKSPPLVRDDDAFLLAFLRARCVRCCRRKSAVGVLTAHAPIPCRPVQQVRGRARRQVCAHVLCLLAG